MQSGILGIQAKEGTNNTQPTNKKIAVAVGTTVLVLLQFVFMVCEIVLVISAWGYLCIESSDDVLAPLAVW